MNGQYARALLLLAACCATTGAVPASPAALRSRQVHAVGNPILADGRDYSADPAPLVADGKLYIIAGRDEAPPEVNDFVIPRWQLLVTDDVGRGRWTYYPALLRPEQVFAWAAPGHAYAAQIVQGTDRRYYLYAPVQEAHSRNADPFAIGVAVADSPLGPWRDAHPQGPILSQSLPVRNTIQNIDPTVLVDDDGRVYVYWGTFGKLFGIELERDMVTPKGPVVAVNTLDGYFEAPWLFKRRDTYYMAYAANNAGLGSACTPTLYHACIAYGTAPSPLGPWTYRGVVLDPVSSTTSHPGIVQFKGQWYLVYHTADAKGGGHFRRSVAIDALQWDDSVTPARMRKVVPTRPHRPTPSPSRNLAAAAIATASNGPAIPVQYWIAALNDGVVKAHPLPPQMWGSWTSHNPPQQWIQYSWDVPVTLNGSRIVFFADQLAGAAIGVAPPRAWHLEYRTQGRWLPVPGASQYRSAPGRFQQVAFAPVRTRCVRAVFDASGDGRTYAAVAVQEWEMLAPRAQILPPRAPPHADASCDTRVDMP
ncbi:family 43 glycosylhydrolase [Xanthomonas albilineans]|uniref:Putative xylosidase protein n=1 Tax=Xanthomonas albilineans (strain GPE PC73 / CFBP 7063) TaxID=380358 RepID=D2UE42_XANAP|nr:family 43 glycosylhydrolase [Xanthomonas albilineans]QHQ28671.1 putative xylosidase precursor protein [Xanthomonas albilineans]CBA16437.1 putative xylosidase precursor protein [Xanthomonas albilineans GPE PC73]